MAVPLGERLDRLLRLTVNLILYPLAAAIPRSRREWLFGHVGGQFAGNPKYLFLWMRLHRPDIRVRWVTGSRATWRMLRRAGLPVAMRWSPAGIRAALRSGAFVFAHGIDDVNLPLRGGALPVNLWHGVGLKPLHTSRRPHRPIAAWLRSFVHPRDAMVATTSDMMTAHFAGQFGIPARQCPQLGYPRLDVASDAALAGLARSIDARSGFAFDPSRHRETYLYVPTWRDTARPFLEEALPDFARLSAVLAGRDAVLYVKLHPRTPDRLPAEHANIRAWPDAIDFQTYLPELTGIITDYSSVLYDYLALRDDGIILYTFDYDRYVDADRTLLYSFEDNVAGVRVATFDALLAALLSGAWLAPVDPDKLEAIRRRFWSGSPVPASAAVTAYVENELA